MQMNVQAGNLWRVVALSMLAVGITVGRTPVAPMDAMTLGVEYSALWRGQTITHAAVMSRETMHLARIFYAPMEYVQFTLGLGADRFGVDDYQQRRFEGNYGLSPLFGLALYSPAIARGAVRFGASVEYRRFSSGDEHGYEYRGGVIAPEAGLVIHAGRAVEIQAGAAGLVFDGIMASETAGRIRSEEFSNNENVRGFFRFTLISPSGAYGQFYFDASPEAGRTIVDGPEEASLGFSIGVLLKEDRKSRKAFENNSKYFPAFEKMKKTEERMRKEMEQ